MRKNKAKRRLRKEGRKIESILISANLWMQNLNVLLMLLRFERDKRSLILVKAKKKKEKFDQLTEFETYLQTCCFV